MKKRILLLSAYDAMSHRLWRTGLAGMFPEFDWTQLALPARHFSWRIRGNSLTWGFSGQRQLTARYDLIIATSLVDMASLRGFCPALAEVPTLVYFHENQFCYPRNKEQSAPAHDTHLDAAMVSIYTALCGDRIIFNSEYNRHTFLAGAAELMQRLPDHVPDGIVHRLRHSEVLPVPLQIHYQQEPASPRLDPQVLQVAWNHRWEYDKGPELLLAIVEEVVARNLPVRFHLMGQQFRRRPAVMDRLVGLLTEPGDTPAAHVGHVADRRQYHRRLAGCDVVLSTARHDFQGLAILEACALGCTPLCPDDLVYPEYLQSDFLYKTDCSADLRESAGQAVDRLARWQRQQKAGVPLPGFNPVRFTAARLKDRYRAVFDQLLQQPGVKNC